MMRVLKVKKYGEIPEDYTGIAEMVDGSKRWFLNGKLHREDGPAVEWSNGSKRWFLNGKYHREDGPACEYADGEKVWYLNDNFLFRLLPESQTFILLEEFIDEEGKEQLRVLNQKGIEIWPCVPGLKELADNWEKKQ